MRSPCSLNTWGTPAPVPVKPPLAQCGSASVRTREAHGADMAVGDTATGGGAGPSWRVAAEAPPAVRRSTRLSVAVAMRCRVARRFPRALTAAAVLSLAAAPASVTRELTRLDRSSDIVRRLLSGDHW